MDPVVFFFQLNPLKTLLEKRPKSVKISNKNVSLVAIIYKKKVPFFYFLYPVSTREKAFLAFRGTAAD